MNSIEIYEFHYDEKTSDLLKKLSEENSSEISNDSVCFEEIEFSNWNCYNMVELVGKPTRG